jgi:carbonic anhydrase
MTAHRFPNVGELIAANGEYAARFDAAALQVAPTRHLAIVACMDSRMDIFALLGLGNGEAHVIRNAGGIVTDDVIRSLCLSQRSLGTREIVLVHHTDCGLQKIDATDFKEVLEAETGIKPSWAVESFADPYRDVVQSANRLRASPFLHEKQHISGFVYNVETGLLERVEL